MADEAHQLPDGSTEASWEFAGWGRAERLTHLPPATTVTHLDQPKKHMLGVWGATAICGNDITSSVLYVSALCAAEAGVLAPIVLIFVSLVLYLYRRVYAEVGSALPLNGGTYTLLLNTTSKRIAAGAACLTLLSYVATAVISATEAMHYASNLLPNLDVFSGTIGLLGVFALLNILGVSESAVIALIIFVLHIVTLAVLAVAGTIAVAHDPSLLAHNWALPEPRGVMHALFFGFAAAMLGISGFESSANFIEEQQPGVFPKTLRNMWLAVAVINPWISLLSLGLLPLAQIRQVPPDLLATMGSLSAGHAFGTWISIDAVLVLSGAVLTSYVGVTGLVRRMSLDRCLPQVLLAENRWRDTNHWIILGFFAVCTSILVITEGSISLLAGVYTLAFLSVMALFAVGNMMLKSKRAQLPRDVRASWTTVWLALAGVLTALVGNLLLAPQDVAVFAIYYGIALAVVGAMLMRLSILRLSLSVLQSIMDSAPLLNRRLRAAVARKMEAVGTIGVVYFTRGDALDVLNRAALYVLENEQTTRMKVVHVYGEEGDIPPDLGSQLATLDRLYPPLRIDFLAVKGTFGPQLIEQLSRHLTIPKNLMFIGTPSDRFPHRIEELGGVRVIL